MSKSATEIEAEVRRLLAGCRLSARGLWHEMRYLIETESDRPGHLRLNGRPMSDEQLALRAGCSSGKVAPTLQGLVDVGLIANADRCWHSPHLARIAAKLAAGAKRVRDHRLREAENQGGVLRNTPCNADVTPAAAAPPSLSPTPPISYPPSPSGTDTPGEGGRAVAVATRRGRAVAEAIPAEIDTPAFRDAWASFVRHRGQLRGVAFTPEAARLNLAKCAKWGVEQAVRNVIFSTEQSWRSIFPAKPDRNGEQRNGHHAAKSRRPTAAERGEYAEHDEPLPTL